MVASLLITLKSVLLGNFFRKTSFVFLTGLLCLIELPVSQKSTCGVRVTKEQMLYDLNHIAGTHKKLNQLENSYKLALSIHILRTDDGDGAVALEPMYKNVTELNKSFAPILMGFEITNIKYIDNSKLFDFAYLYDRELLESYCIPNTINIFYVNDITIRAGGDYCGFTHYPTAGKDFILLKNACIENNTSLIHEMGHYFGLYHTHETSFGLESKDGSDCNITGDLICDTPVEDITVSGVIAKENFEGGEMMSKRNFMSYAQKDKRNTFTQGQYNKIVEVYCAFKAHIDKINVSLTASDTLIYKGSPVKIKAKGGHQIEWSTGECGNEITLTPLKDTLIEATVCTAKYCVYKRITIKVSGEPKIIGPKQIKTGSEANLAVTPTSPYYSYQLYCNDRPYGLPHYGNGGELNFKTWKIHKDAIFKVQVNRPGQKSYFLKHAINISVLN